MADELPPTQPPLDDGDIVTVDIEDEVQRSYLDYAMSVIVGRALPDVRDGLKPVHRRILWGMLGLGARPTVQHLKCARVVGEVMGKYHPHGDAAIYDALARMAQDFAMRHTLVDGKGNFGSVDGDPPAASRYTECRLSPLAMELLRDIDEDTVDLVANYDGREEEPAILPSRFPNLLVNGSTGIAVGMATNIPPHNLGEVIDATVALLDNPELVSEDLMKIVRGPDFPGGGSILGRTGIKDAYETGRGSVRVRGKAEIEESKRGHRIVVTELPYMVSGDRLLEKIHELVEAKRVTGISNGRNESSRKGIRIVIELKRDAIPQVVLNNLYKFTQLQDSFGMNMLALVDGVPRTLPLVDILRAYIQHQVAVVTRRTRFRLRKAEGRMHILMGLLVALDQLDAIITLIREAESAEVARTQLMQRAWEVSPETRELLLRAGVLALAPPAEPSAAPAGGAGAGQMDEAGTGPQAEDAELGHPLDDQGRFHLSERQATAILDMELRRLAGLERQNLRLEAGELAGTIAELRSILDSPAKLRRLIREELSAIRDKFASPRRTQIIADEGEIDLEDLIPDEDVVITITRSGYVKRTKSAIYKLQGRGGKGVIGAKPKEGDIVSQVLTTTNHAFVLVFSTRGKVYRIKAHEIPEKERTARGTSIRNILPFTPEEAVAAVIDTRDFETHRYLVVATKKGIIKKTEFNAYNTSRKDGIIALTLREDDEVVMVKATSGEDELIMVSRKGMAIRFPETDVRPMGRTAAGVIAMSLSAEDVVVDFDVVDQNAELLIVTDGGYGKRTLLTQYPTQHRGGKGVITAKLPGRRGVIAGAYVVRPGHEVFLIASDGQVIRMEARSIARQGRDTTGVRVMRLDPGVSLVGLAPVNEEE
jgi:DNA gyrase subunit A